MKGSQVIMHNRVTIPKWFALLLLEFCLLQQNCFSQYYPFQRHLGPEDGLLESLAWGIVQDDQGFMYVATSFGISRFDGFDIRNYKIKSVSSRGQQYGRNVYSIIRFREHFLLLGTNKGVCVFNCTTGKFQGLFEPARVSGLSENQVTALDLDIRNRRLWIATENGLQVLDEFSSVPRMATQNPIHSRKWINAIVSAGSTLFVGTQDGLWEFDIKTEKYSETPVRGTVGVPVSALDSDTTSHQIWAGTSTGLLLCYANGKWFQVDSIGIWITKIAHSGDQLWVGTTKNLIRYNIADLLIGKGEPTLIDGAAGIISLYASPSDGLLWAGRYLKGVSLIDPNYQGEFVSQQYDRNDVNGLATGNVWSICQSRDSTIWLGLNRKGLDAMNPKTGITQHYNDLSKPGLPSGKTTVFSILEDSKENLWLGTLRGGLLLCHRSQGGDITEIEEVDDNVLREGKVTSLCDPGDGRIWIAAMDEGLFYLDLKSREIRPYSPPPGILAENLVGAFSLQYDRQDESHLYVGTKGGGLFSIDLANNANTQNYVLGSNEIIGALPDNSINSFALDRKDPNILWISTASSGILKFDKEQGKVIKVFNDSIVGFPDNNIYAIKQDTQGNLWFSTNFGIAELDPENSQILRSYTQEDGLGSREFNDGAHYMNEETGDIFFGSNNGFCMINPEKLAKGKNTFRKVQLINLQVEGKTKSPGETLPDGTLLPENFGEIPKLSFEEGHANVRMSFSSFSYQLPRRSNYEYAFVDLNEVQQDTSWTPFPLTDSITGDALPGNIVEIFRRERGDFHLIVRTSNIQTGQPSDKKYWFIIDFSVFRPLQKQVWIYLVLGGLIGITFLSFARRRRAMLKEIQEGRIASQKQKEAEEKLQLVIEKQQEVEEVLSKSRLDYQQLNEKNTLLDQAVSKKTKQFESWNAIAEKLATTLDLSGSLPAMFEALSHAMPIDSLSIGRLSEDGTTLLFDWNLVRTQEGLVTAESFSRANDADKSIGGLCISKQRSNLGDKVEVILEELSLADRESLIVAREETQSLAGCCMIVENEIVGVVVIKSFEPCSYSEEQMDLLRAVATTCGITIKNLVLNNNLKSEKNERVGLAAALGHDIRSLFGLLDHQWVKPLDAFFELSSGEALEIPRDKIGRIIFDERNRDQVETMGLVPIRQFLTAFAKLGSTWTGHFRQDQISLSDNPPRNLEEAILAAWDFAKEVAVISVLRKHPIDTLPQLEQLGSLRHALRGVWPQIEFIGMQGDFTAQEFSDNPNSEYHASLMRFLLTLFMNVLKHCDPSEKVSVHLTFDEERMQVELGIINHTWPEMDSGLMTKYFTDIADKLIVQGRLTEGDRGLVKSIYNARGKFSGIAGQGSTAWKTPETLKFLLETKLNGKMLRFQPQLKQSSDNELWETVCTFAIH